MSLLKGWVTIQNNTLHSHFGYENGVIISMSKMSVHAADTPKLNPEVIGTFWRRMECQFDCLALEVSL